MWSHLEQSRLVNWKIVYLGDQIQFLKAKLDINNMGFPNPDNSKLFNSITLVWKSLYICQK